MQIKKAGSAQDCPDLATDRADVPRDPRATDPSAIARVLWREPPNTA